MLLNIQSTDDQYPILLEMTYFLYLLDKLLNEVDKAHLVSSNSHQQDTLWIKTLVVNFHYLNMNLWD